MNRIAQGILVTALVVMGTGAASAETINFDDAYASLGDLGNPATYYSSEGVTITGDYLGIVPGLGYGDPGGWGLEGTNGSASLGCNAGDSCSPTFDFASPVDDVSLDIGLANDWSATFTVSGYLDDALVDSDTFTIADTGTTGGTWDTFTLNGNVDQVVVSSSFVPPGFAYGLDNVQFQSATPEPASLSMMLLGAAGIGIGAIRRRKRKQNQ